MKSRIDISWVGGRKPWKAKVWVWGYRKSDDGSWMKPSHWITERVSLYDNDPGEFVGKTPEEVWHQAKELIDAMQRDLDCPKFAVATPDTLIYDYEESNDK